MQGIAGSGRTFRVALEVALAVAALCWSGAVAALATSVSIGERMFEAIAPQGFIETGVYHPEVKRQFQSVTLSAGAIKAESPRVAGENSPPTLRPR